MKRDLRTFVIRCCLLGLILGHISVIQCQPRRNGRTRVTQARHQVISPRRQGTARGPSVRQSLTVVRGASGARGARGNRRPMASPQRAPKTNTRTQQLTRLRQRSRALRRPVRTNIQGAGLNSFLGDNRPRMMHRANIRPPARQRGTASLGTPRIFARNLQVLDGRRPSQAGRLLDQGTAANSRSPVRIRARLRTNSAPAPTTSTRTSSTSTKSATTAKSNPRTSPSQTNTLPRARQTSGAASNMISIDSLLSLINGIRGQSGGATGKSTPSGSNAARPGQRSLAASSRRGGVPINPTASTVFKSTTPSRRPLPAAGSGQTAGAVDMQAMMTLFDAGAGAIPADTPAFDQSLAMLAMMNPGEGIFSSFTSNPVIVSEFASGSALKSIGPTPSSNAVGNNAPTAAKAAKNKKTTQQQGTAGGKKKKQRPTKPQDPTLGVADIIGLSQLGNSGNAAQKKMLNNLLFKSLPEELRENIQKRMAKSAKPTTPLMGGFEHKRLGK